MPAKRQYKLGGPNLQQWSACSAWARDGSVGQATAGPRGRSVGIYEDFLFRPPPFFVFFFLIFFSAGACFLSLGAGAAARSPGRPPPPPGTPLDRGLAGLFEKPGNSAQGLLRAFPAAPTPFSRLAKGHQPPRTFRHVLRARHTHPGLPPPAINPDQEN